MTKTWCTDLNSRYQNGYKKWFSTNTELISLIENEHIQIRKETKLPIKNIWKWPELTFEREEIGGQKGENRNQTRKQHQKTYEQKFSTDASDWGYLPSHSPRFLLVTEFEFWVRHMTTPGYTLHTPASLRIRCGYVPKLRQENVNRSDAYHVQIIISQ